MATPRDDTDLGIGGRVQSSFAIEAYRQQLSRMSLQDALFKLQRDGRYSEFEPEMSKVHDPTPVPTYKPPADSFDRTTTTANPTGDPNSADARVIPTMTLPVIGTIDAGQAALLGILAFAIYGALKKK